jgi:hypothetical protein
LPTLEVPEKVRIRFGPDQSPFPIVMAARPGSGVVVFLAISIAGSGSGCALPGGPSALAASPVSNPLYVNSNNEDAVWERTVAVIHEFHFGIARENRQSRVIETDYFVGSGVLEPWHSDSVGTGNRLESTFQSIRRKVLVNILPDNQSQGYLVSVEAFKELEDLPGLAANSAGAATFSNFEPLRRDLNPVVGQSAPSGWIPLGRDVALEGAILGRLQACYSQR